MVPIIPWLTGLYDWRTALIILAFGMWIIAYDPHMDAETMNSLGAEKKNLDQLLAESDILSLHAPLTPETRNMLGLEQFKKMKPGAYIVNTARGGLIDQEALCMALKDGILAGAALDVMDPEPIDPDNPLLELENVILTPHIGSRTHESVGRQATMAIWNLVAVLKGEEPQARAT